MKYINMPGTDLKASNVVVGCMHLAEISEGDANKLINTALENGVNFFDHADIYMDGEHACEKHFAKSVGMNAVLRERMILQSKCGIHLKEPYYDFSKERILTRVDESLKALKTDYLDILLLHRPDVLVEPEEVAEAFADLHSKGKVRYFGVSNQRPRLIEYLQKYIPYKFVVNQLQLSIMHTPMFDADLTMNMGVDNSADRDGEVLSYCRMNDITIQAWSPMQRGFFEGAFLGDREHCAELNDVIDALAAKYGVPATAVAVSFITCHPANMQVILGTTKPRRVIESVKGSDLALTKAEWYELYRAAGNLIP